MVWAFAVQEYLGELAGKVAVDFAERFEFDDEFVEDVVMGGLVGGVVFVCAGFDTGVFGVPTYLVEDEMWFGREHLPRVQWLLCGRSGQPGDVENRSFRR